MLQDHGRGGQRFQQVCERDHHHGFGFRQRHQAQLGFEDDAQRAFGADHDLGEIHGLDGVREFVQVVAADAAQDLGIAAVDFGGVLGGKAQHGASNSGFERSAARLELASRGMSRKCTTLPSESDHGLLQNVVDGLAVQHAARAGGVVGHHAADGGAAGGGNIGREAQPSGASCAFNSSSTMPGSTRAQRSSAFTSSTRL